MEDVIALVAQRMTQALLPAPEAGSGGQVIVMSSTASHLVCEGGGCTTANHAETY